MVPNNKIRKNIMMQIKNKIFAMVLEVLATPEKPKKPAITEITKNIIAHFNIVFISFVLIAD
jgi:hypothetical protein